MKSSVPVVPVTNPSRPARARASSQARSEPSVSLSDFDSGCDRLMRRREVQRTTGLSRSSLYRLIAVGSFPSPILLSANAVGWLETEVSAWIAGRVAASRSGQSQPATTPGRP
ncbi:MAG: helix-turn-helix transcriptional regulator [Terriglobia bacterium]